MEYSNHFTQSGNDCCGPHGISLILILFTHTETIDKFFIPLIFVL